MWDHPHLQAERISADNERAMRKQTQTKVLRCFAEKVDSEQAVAVCLTLNLAAQADSLDSAVGKLYEQIDSYITDISPEGVDFEHQASLLNRPAPLSLWLHYWKLRIRSVFIGYVENKDKAENKDKFFTKQLSQDVVCS